MTETTSPTIAFLTANEGVEQIELTEPWEALERAGFDPVLVAPDLGKVQAFDHLDRADSFEATITTADLDVSSIAGIVLPGGVANPDQLRTDAAAVQMLRDAAERGIPIAVICHGPWTLVEADAVRGRTLTSWPSLRTDIRNAGGNWVDEDVVVCTDGPGAIVSSRKPDDLPAFTREMLLALRA